MIASKTKKIAIVASLVLVSTMAITAVSIWLVMQQSVLLQQQVLTIATDRAQEEAFVRLKRKVSDTQEERADLESYFLVSQSDSIDFLNYIETLAQRQGVVIETSSPTEKELNGQTFLSVGYNVSGSLTQLETFIALLEVLPYVSQVQSVSLNKQTDTLWQASVQIDVTLLSYE